MARVLLGILGAILLLPGLCSLAFIGMFGSNGADAMWMIWLITFVIGWGGFMLLRRAWRG